MLNIHTVMTELAKTRPIFHSEADFQFALAWQIREMMPGSQIRLEFKPFSDGRMYLDIWIRDQEMAIELKYKTQRMQREHDGEQFTLREQAAQDLGCYDFLKDIERIETIKSSGLAKHGFAIMLTNDLSYCRLPKISRRPKANPTDFRIYEGRVVTGNLEWQDPTAPSVSGRQAPINLRGSYSLNWKDYSEVPGTGNFCQFRYLAIAIGE